MGAITEDILSRLLIVGANHRSSPLSLRDALFIEDPEVAEIIKVCKEAANVEAVVPLSTCDRVELIALMAPGQKPAEVGLALQNVLKDRAIARQAPTFGGHPVYIHYQAEALRHLFAVSASLDSMVVGEPQILGQVKVAHKVARDGGGMTASLDGILQAAYACAKKIRTETAIAEGPVSVATAAIQVAGDLHGELAGCQGLLLGAGEMGELVAETLKSRGLAGLTVAAPRETRARDVARRLGANVADYNDLADAMALADILICCTGGRHLAVTEDGVKAALRRRRQKPMFVIDVSLPGDVEPSVDRLSNAFLYDLEDLERVAEQGRGRREAAAAAAWTVLEEELGAYLKDRAQRGAVPAITALRAAFEAERLRVLAEMGMDAQQGEAAKATTLLLNRLLHNPSVALKDLAEEGFEAEAQALLARMFPSKPPHDNE